MYPVQWRLFIFVWLVPALIIASASRCAGEVSLESLISELLSNNPEIQAAGQRQEAAAARPSQARTLPDPVVFFVTRNPDGNPLPFTELGNDPAGSIGFMWEQELPYSGKLKLAGTIAEREAESLSFEAEVVRWNVVSKFKQAFFEYYRADRSLRILRESRDLLKQFLKIAEARYAVGESIQQDVLRAQVELSILDQRMTTLEQERESFVAELNRLLNRPVEAPLGEPEGIKPSVVGIAMKDLMQEWGEAPQILSAEAMVEREKAGLQLSRRQYRPDFMTSVEYAKSPNFPDMWQFQIGLRIPLFYKKKQQFGVVESARNLSRAEKELVSVKQETALDVHHSLLQIEASAKLLKLYEQGVIPQSELALESGLASYQVGKADFLTTISNFLTLLEYRINYVEELAKHESAIARLEQSLGRPFETLSADGGQSHE